MVTKYECSNCGEVFAAQTPQRCPACLRQHGIRPARHLGKSPRQRRSRLGRRRLLVLVTAAVLIASLAAAALLLRRAQTTLPKPGQLAILGSPSLRRTLIQRGIPAERVVEPFAADHAVLSLLPKAQGASVEELAKALSAKLSGVKLRALDIGAVTAVDAKLRRSLGVRTAAQLASQLAAGNLTTATSYELSVLALSLCRAAGLNAVLAEAHTLSDAPVVSADVRGYLGRYVVVVYQPGKLGGAKLATLDPARALKLPAWQGSGADNSMTSKAKVVVPLDDASAAAHLLSLRALWLARVGAQLRSPTKKAPKAIAAPLAEAYELSRLALLAAAPSPTLHLARAVVLTAAGGVGDALAEAKSALALRDDAPRQTRLAEYYLAAGNPERARSHLSQALKHDPKAFPALVVLAKLHWLAGERDKGDRLLAQAVRVAPEAPEVISVLAGQKMAAGDADAAIALLRELIERTPSPEALVQLYLALRSKGDGAAAARRKQQLLEMVDEDSPAVRALAAIDEQLASAGSAGQPADNPAPDAPPSLPKMPPIKLPDVRLGQP